VANNLLFLWFLQKRLGLRMIGYIGEDSTSIAQILDTTVVTYAAALHSETVSALEIFCFFTNISIICACIISMTFGNRKEKHDLTEAAKLAKKEDRNKLTWNSDYFESLSDLSDAMQSCFNERQSDQSDSVQSSFDEQLSGQSDSCFDHQDTNIDCE
jgi:hypothetical protein